jgi:hypothetical protein
VFGFPNPGLAASHGHQNGDVSGTEVRQCNIAAAVVFDKVQAAQYLETVSVMCTVD